MITQQEVKLNYANPTELDVDSTVQEANMAYPAIPNLLIKVAVLASKVGNTHEHLFGKGLLASLATDKGYYSLSNE